MTLNSPLESRAKEIVVPKPDINIQRDRPKIAVVFILTGLFALLFTKIWFVVFFLDPILGVYSFLTIFLVLSSFIFSYMKYKDPTIIGAANRAAKKQSKLPGIFDGHQLWNPLVSIIVPCKNDPEVVPQGVYSMIASTYKKIEIILVNDGSTDNATGPAMDQMACEFPDKVRVIHLKENLGKRKATRAGIYEGKARGDAILVVDSDCVLEERAIEYLVQSFDAEENVGAVCGLGRSLNPNYSFLTKMQDVWYDGQFSVAKGCESAFSNVTCLPGILSMYRREALMPCIDRWAEDRFLGVEFTFGDDRHLTSYVLGGNQHYIDKSLPIWKTLYSDRAIVFTENPTNFKKFVNQQVRWKKSWFRVFFFTLPFYYKNRPPYAAAVYYLQMIWSFVSPIVALRALVILPLTGHYLDAIVYLAGLTFIGLLFGIEFKMRNPDTGHTWMYRLLWSWMGLFLSSLEYWSMITIRNKSWLTR